MKIFSSNNTRFALAMSLCAAALLTTAACSKNDANPAAPEAPAAKTTGEVIQPVLAVESVYRILTGLGYRTEYKLSFGETNVELATERTTMSRTDETTDNRYLFGFFGSTETSVVYTKLPMTDVAGQVIVENMVFQVTDLCLNEFCNEIVALVTLENTETQEVIQNSILISGKSSRMEVVAQLPNTSFDEPKEAIFALQEELKKSQPSEETQEDETDSEEVVQH